MLEIESTLGINLIVQTLLSRSNQKYGRDREHPIA